LRIAEGTRSHEVLRLLSVGRVSGERIHD
jgi:hypothetical protein